MVLHSIILYDKQNNVAVSISGSLNGKISAKTIDVFRYLPNESVFAEFGVVDRAMDDGSLSVGVQTADSPIALFTHNGIIALKAGGGQTYMFLENNNIEIGAGSGSKHNVHFTLNIEPDNQHGIYARFA